jgi:hypothetical protein
LPGSSPYEAVANFLRPLQLAVSCVTDAVLRPSPGGYDEKSGPHSITWPDFPPHLRQQAPGDGLYLSVAHYYRIVEDATAQGPFRVRSAGYSYILHDVQGHELFAFQWHPQSSSHVTRPHLHLGVGLGVTGAMPKLHVPTGRVALEQVIRLAIDLDALPIRDDWEAILDASEADFVRWRSWA